MAYSRNTSTSAAARSVLNRGVEFPKGPEDTVSALRWSPVSDHVAAASWDGRVYIYDAARSTSTGDIKGVAAMAAPAHAVCLDCDFSKDGTLIAAGASDKAIHIMDLASGGAPTATLPGHSAPVRAVRFVAGGPAAGSAPLLVSGSWDGTVRCWDLRAAPAAGPVATAQLGERVYAMDVSGGVVVAATADRKIHLLHLFPGSGSSSSSSSGGGGGGLRASNPGVEVVDSPLRHQPTAVAVSADGSRWAVAGVEGRVAVQALDERERSFNFSFKCHRHPAAAQQQPLASRPAKSSSLPSSSSSSTTVNVYAVNSIAFAPSSRATLATAGSDGALCVWDLDRHQRVKHMPPILIQDATAAITSVAFSRGGGRVAYAVGYDWARGYRAHREGYPTQVRVVDLSGGN